MQVGAWAVIVAALLNGTKAGSINYDKVQPFSQSEPITDAEKAAVTFKPSIAVKSGCHPYPAVNTAGETSSGLEAVGASDQNCPGPKLGSQIYSRLKWYVDKWAIMYAWYFPKDVSAQLNSGVRHDWVNLIVWLDNPAIKAPTVLATSASTYGRSFIISKPAKVSDIINGITPKTRYDENGDQGYRTVFQFDGDGESQDLIQWEQLTEEARLAFNTTDFGEDTPVPFNDFHFEDNLKAASSYSYYTGKTYGYQTRSIWS